MTNELLEFPGGVRGLALNLEEREIGCVLLGDGHHIEEGSEVRRTGEVLSVPVGDAFLGRVVDALGEPIDGKGPIEASGRRVLELQAPTVVQRQSVKQPLQTGIKAIDAMTAIGRGQRQLIIGDRQTGKTAVAIDAIINQRDNWKTGDKAKQVKCVYVAIGQKGSTIAGLVSRLEEAGAMEYTTVVAAAADAPGRPEIPLALHRVLDRPALDVRRRATSSSSSTTSPSRPRPTAPSRCCSAARRAARPTPATSSICTAGCSSAAPSSPTTSAAAR